MKKIIKNNLINICLLAFLELIFSLLMFDDYSIETLVNILIHVLFLSLIILKGIYLLILSILFKTIFQLLKQVLNYLKNENQNIKNIFIIYGKRIFLLSFILIINDIFIKLWGSNILNILIEIIN